MLKITESKLKKLGFTPSYLPVDGQGRRIPAEFEYDKGNVMVERDGETFSVKVYSAITTDTLYAREAKGVRTEEDLITLCRLIDG